MPASAPPSAMALMATALPVPAALVANSAVWLKLTASPPTISPEPPVTLALVLPS